MLENQLCTQMTLNRQKGACGEHLHRKDVDRRARVASTQQCYTFLQNTPGQRGLTRGVVEHLGCSRDVSPTNRKTAVTLPEP